MGCKVWLWLLLILRALGGMARGDTETVLGTLGKATILKVPERLRELTKDSGEASWKRGGPQKKQVLVKYSGGNSTNNFLGQMSFQESDFSLEILNTTRWDGQLYEYSVSKGTVEEVQQVQLKVYAPVSTPTIQILSMELANGSCSITLNCTAEQGDDVSYSWDSLASRTSGLCSGNSSFLHLSYPLRNSSSISCICTATNPVSNRTVTFSPNQCSHQPGGSVGLRMELLVLLVVPVVVLIAMVLVGVLRTHNPALHLAHQEPSRQDSTDHTIYSQVQRVQKPKGPPSSDTPSCTTIYAAATGPPRALAELPPNQEPTTVYVGVMMPRP